MDQDIVTLIVLALLVFVLAIVGVYLYFKGRLNVLKENEQRWKVAHEASESKVNALLGQEESLAKEVQKRTLLQVELESELRHLREKLNQLRDDQDLQLQQFENIATRVLEKEGERFKKMQHNDMGLIIDPLKERIKEFELKIERTHHESIKRHQSLKEHISFLGRQSQQVALDAQRLSKALSADFKKQGNWGELILESILDKSGLEKNREYRVQTSVKDEEGKIFRPDVVIYLPDSKQLIIDSKVSLNAYNKMVNAEDEDEERTYQKAHALAVKKHIDVLSGKKYQNLYGSTPDFVLMFIPLDTAFTAALKYDPELYQYGFEKNIVVVTSSTLLATLKTVETMWRNDKQNRNARKIAAEAGKMYDKLVGFAATMRKLGMQIHTVQNSYNTAIKQLESGRGNLMKKAVEIKKLGAKTSKSVREVLPDWEEE